MAEVVTFVDPAAAYQKYLNAIDQDLTRVIAQPAPNGTIDLGGGSGTLILTNGTLVQNITMPDPDHLGQKVDICMDTIIGGSISVNYAPGWDPAGVNSGLVFDAAGESVRCVAMTEGGSLTWRIFRADGVEPGLT